MLTPVWYALLFMLQVAQMDPGVEYSRLNLDLFIDSAPVWTVTVKGTARDGVLYDGKTLLGEYDASSRISQAYLVYPQSLPPEREGTDASDSGTGKTSSTKTPAPAGAKSGTDKALVEGSSPATGDTAAEEELPGVFAIDFTKLVKQLKSSSREGTLKLIPDLPLADAKDAKKGTGSGSGKSSGVTKASPAPKASAKPAVSAAAAGTASPDAGASASEEVPEDVMELRRYPNRTVLAWPSQGIVVVMTTR